MNTDLKLENEDMRYYSELTEDEKKDLHHEDFLEITLNEDVVKFNKSDMKFTTRLNHLIIVVLLGILVSFLEFNVFGLFTLLSFIPAIIISLSMIKPYKNKKYHSASLNVNICLAKTSGIIDDDNYYLVEKYLNRIIINKNIFLKMF